MVHLILTGATGMVGYGVLTHMLSNSAVSRVSILSRRPIDAVKDNDKVKVIIHNDYDHYPPEVLDQLKGAKGVVWAQGVSQNEVTKDEYIKITHDYPLAAAHAFSSLSDQFNFVHVSGEGATTNPGPFTFLYAKVKGETETALLAFAKDKPAFNAYNVRPAMVYPEKDFFEVMKRPMRLEFRLFSSIVKQIKAWTSHTSDLGRFLTHLAMGDGKPFEGDGVTAEGRTINNVAFQRLLKTF